MKKKKMLNEIRRQCFVKIIQECQAEASMLAQKAEGTWGHEMPKLLPVNSIQVLRTIAVKVKLMMQRN